MFEQREEAQKLFEEIQAHCSGYSAVAVYMAAQTLLASAIGILCADLPQCHAKCRQMRLVLYNIIKENWKTLSASRERSILMHKPPEDIQ